MKMKLHQVLTAYVCDTAQTEVTSKGAQKYLKDHDILDTDVERISEQLLKKQIRELKVKNLLLDFYNEGMQKVLKSIKDESGGIDFEDLYERNGHLIDELL